MGLRLYITKANGPRERDYSVVLGEKGKCKPGRKGGLIIARHC